MSEAGEEGRRYDNENQQNLMTVFEYLAQDILIPKSQRELMDALGLTQNVAFRTLWNLADRGWIEETGRGYRLAPRMTMISDRLRLELADTLRKYLPEGGK